MSAKTIEASRIAGALKCLDALRKLDQSADIDNSWQTETEFYAQRLSDSRAMVAALGPMTPEQEGAIAVLAEYIHVSINSGMPDLNPPGVWIPLSAMTDSERQAMIERAEADHAADVASMGEHACTVISMAERRAAR